METQDVIRTSRVENVTLLKGKGKGTRGTLILTATHFIYIDAKKREEIWVLYMMVHSVKRGQPSSKGARLDISCKDFRTLHFIIPKESECIDIHDALTSLALPGSMESLYAFSFQPDFPVVEDGWKIYDAVAEYTRMGLSPAWEISEANKEYKICPTYPSVLAFPSSVSQQTLEESGKFRSKGRLPSLSYMHHNQTSICRCSQPLTGVQSKRSRGDEDLVHGIHTTNPSCETKGTIIVDTRPKVNAIANKAGGKGYENTEGYPDCTLVFHGIQNIHVMRDSLAGLLKACQATESTTFFSLLDGCGWLKHIKGVLDTSLVIVQYILRGHNVIVHCSDGWDRTAQTCSLSQLLLDPYYRTLRGFIVLVEKEWLSFGHKFSDRNAFLSTGSSKEVSPIFLQFLEATWQIAQQFPRAFEFNELFLITLHDCLHSAKFGTFLGNCERVRKENKLPERTTSVWSFILARKEEFTNCLYDMGEPAHQGHLLPDTSPQRISLWTSMYCRWDSELHPRQKLSQSKRAAMETLRLHSELEQNRLVLLQQRVQELQEAKAAGRQALPARVIADFEPMQGVEDCSLCSTPFDFLASKRHCVLCGRVFCFKCLYQSQPLPELLLDKKRACVCTTCHRTRNQ
eukprot:m.63709 g.63709  ORF g.63709 m.63709 type:complete len:628 (+) comp13493_c0_seq3:144-2027(+)